MKIYYDFDIMTEAAEEATLQKAVEDARNLLNEGVAPKDISRCVGLPLEQVLDLQKQAR